MSKRAIIILKTLLHLLCLAPFAWLLHLFTSSALSNYADPINYITHFTAIAGIIHYCWLVKKGNYAPAFDTLVLTVLLLARVAYVLIKRSKKPTATLKSASAR